MQFNPIYKSLFAVEWFGCLSRMESAFGIDSSEQMQHANVQGGRMLSDFAYQTFHQGSSCSSNCLSGIIRSGFIRLSSSSVMILSFLNFS